MKILLLNPPFHEKFSRSSRSPATTRGGTIYYPIMLAYAAGVLEEAGFEVKLIDAPAKGYDLNKTLETIEEFKPELVIVDTSTPSIKNDVDVAAKIKGKLQVPVFLVGTHVSARPKETLEMSEAIDGVARGEYDYIVRDLANALKEGKGLKDGKDLKGVKGITYRDRGRDNEGDIVVNEDREFIHDLDELPWVSKVYKKHLDVKDYFFAAAEYPMVMMMSGRGCPSQCFFCNWPQVLYGHRYRLRSPENVVGEFEWIVENLPEVKEIGIEDDTFSADLKRIKEICRMLIEKGLDKKVRWWANTRVNLDLETMKLMKQAGCRLIIPGYESGVQELLNNAKKGIRIEQSREYAKNAKKAGLLVHGCFMFGLPGETEETIRQTIEFAKELNPDTAQFFPLIPYPGTEAYEWAKKNNYLRVTDFSDWLDDEGHHNTILDLPNLSSEDLVKWCDIARKEYYLRPSYILYKLGQMVTHPSEIRRTMKSFRTFSKSLLPKRD